jgi:hypothetical protein
MNKYHNDRIKNLSSLLKGLKVEQVRWFSNNDSANQMWYSRPVEIILEGGISLIPMQDEEGNDGGAISTNIKGFETLGVMPVNKYGYSNEENK